MILTDYSTDYIEPRTTRKMFKLKQIVHSQETLGRRVLRLRVPLITVHLRAIFLYL